MVKNKGKKSEKMSLKSMAIFIIIVAIVFALIDLLYRQIIINTSDSHKGTIFWKVDKKPEKNDFVYFEFQHRLLSKNTRILSKKLVCTEGDNLVIGDSFIVCNSQKYPIKRNKKTGGGKLIDQFYYNGIVPKNKGIVWGSNLDSFDSRYWGFINYDSLRAMKLIL